MRHFIFLMIFVVFASCQSQSQNGVVVSTTGNITIIKVWGTHYERGYAVGYLLADKIYNIYTGYIAQQFGSYLSSAKTIIQQGQSFTVDQKYIDEAQGIYAGMVAAGVNTTGLDYLDILVANTFLDLSNFPFTKKVEGPGCSSLMSWGDATNGTSLNGRSVISRHLDWSASSYLVNNQVMVIHFPSEANEQPWLLIGFAGQMGVLSGLNNSGLSIFQHQLSDNSAQGQVNLHYVPIWLSARNAIESSDYNNDGVNNTSDVRDALLASANGYADGYIITSLAPSTSGNDSLIAMVAELAPNAPYFTFRSNTYSDSIPGDNLYAANYEIKRNNHRHYCSRYLGIVNNIGVGTGMGQAENWNIMRDHSNSGSGNIQFMQVIPEDRQLYLSVYNSSAAYLHTPVLYDLNELFEMPTNISSDKSSKMTLYPNPTRGVVKLNFPEKLFDIFISDVKGEIVYSKLNQTDKNIQVDAIKKGIYLIKVVGNSGSVYYSKLVKQ
jgi:hypothetical protein